MSARKHYAVFLIAGAFLLGLPAFLLKPTRQAAVFSPSIVRHAFISSYGDHSVIHRILYFGLFGFDRKLAEADLLIAGTSHAELGISASEMAGLLQQKLGHPVKVLNIAMGWAEPLAFTFDIIKKYDLKCKIMLFDLFRTLDDDPSGVGRAVLRTNRISAVFDIFDTWLMVLKDWALDPVFPKFSLSEDHVVTENYLSNLVGFRRWDNADVYELWHPVYGSVYRQTPAALLKDPVEGPSVGPSADFTMLPFSTTGDVTTARNRLEAGHLSDRAILAVSTVVPFNKYELERYKNFAAHLGLPMLSVPRDGIKMFDYAHTNHDGRKLVTERIVADWERNASVPLSTIPLQRDRCNAPR